MLKWALLALAIVFEVFATLMLKYSNGFTRLWPTVGLVCGYALAFYLEAQVIRLGVPVGVTYAIWAGSGIVLVAVAGKVLFADAVNGLTLAGIGLIVAGVLVVQVSTSLAH
ncbi:DMT family transporter [Crossiella cryophila]|nr:multidrug efflux SMR transporter [Crossiella cryophila]